MAMTRNETTLGYIDVKAFLERTSGEVIGQVTTDAKVREYATNYDATPCGDGIIEIRLRNGNGDVLRLPSQVPITREVLVLFGLYSGDGAKGSEDPKNLGRIQGSISFSQKEPNIIKFAAREFREILGEGIRFTFSIGEDTARFMAGPGLEALKQAYGGHLPSSKPLREIRPELSPKDIQYLAEKRDSSRTGWEAEEALAFYYQHKEKIREILRSEKERELRDSDFSLQGSDKVDASPRRPFKKGASEAGGTSRADEMHIGGASGFLPLFLKMMHQIEQSLLADESTSSQNLIRWNAKPSTLGEEVDVRRFFEEHSCGVVANNRPSIRGPEAGWLTGCWPRSTEQRLKPKVRISPLFAYACGLYLAEGATPKKELFIMKTSGIEKPAFQFTSSENESLRVVLTALSSLFPTEDTVDSWKVKVGSSYFPELVQIGLKHGVPMLRGGLKGQGKLRTMEISLSIKSWALEVCPAMVPFGDKYSHAEPTGSGVARVHFGASPRLTRWFFPLLMHVAFCSEMVSEERRGRA